MAIVEPVPLVLQDPGYLLWAPVGTVVPTFTVAGSVFTDSWPGTFKMLGATIDGSQLTYSTKVEPIFAAEFFDPLKYATTERAGSFSFNLMNWTLTSWQYALNSSAAPSTVGGSGATLISKIVPPAAGADVRAFLGWESLDHTVRIVMEQCINGAEIQTNFKRAPDVAAIACDFKFEVPASTFPFQIFSAGVARLG